MIIEGFSAERFFFVLALVFVISKIFGELSERIKQPAVLRELLAGVVLGGSALRIVPSTLGEPGYETFHLLGEVGVAVLLFAQAGFTAGVFDSTLFSAITAVVMLTTFICPPLLKIAFAWEKTS